LAARISKRQIKEDPFIENVLKAWEYARAHQQQFFIGLVVIVVAVAAVSWAGHSRKQSRAKASEQFADGLEAFRTGDLKTAEEIFRIVADINPRSQEGAFAQYFLGKCALEAGRNLDAVKAFDAYIDRSASHPFFHDAAMEGKAVALENEHQYAEAAEAYVSLAKNLKSSSFMETTYLRRAAENFRQANQTQRAIEILGSLIDKVTGVEKRDLEIELQMLKG